MGMNWGRTAPLVPSTLRTGGKTLPLVLPTLETGTVELAETMAIPFAPLLAEQAAESSVDGLASTCTTAKELEEGGMFSTTCKAGTEFAAAVRGELMAAFGRVPALPRAAAATSCEW